MSQNVRTQLLYFSGEGVSGTACTSGAGENPTTARVPLFDPVVTACPGGPYDVGNILEGKVVLETLDKEEKLNYLKNHYTPRTGYDKFITQTVMKGKDRKVKTLTFQASWLQKYKWLIYSEAVRGGLCKYCILFPPKDARISITGTLVTKPFQNLSKAGGKDGVLESHERLQYHKDAVEAATTYLRAAANPTETLPYLISERKQAIFDQNLRALECIVKSIILCGKQNLPLRGHRDDSISTASNKGNFLAILHLISEYDVSLREHLDTAMRNATGTSKTVQNEIINVIGNYIRRKATAPLQNENAVFSIIADEVTDKYANQEILSICLRFLDWKDGTPHIKEVFLDFIHLERTTGESIATAITQSLAKHNIDIKQARGQAYDGASNMSSCRVGVQARIKQIVPQALYIHCSNHILNLSIAAACKIPSIRDTIDVLNAVFLFFDMSPKRQRLLERVLEVYECESRVKKLKGLCKTRWVERHTCYETFDELYIFIIITLEALLDPGSFNNVYYSLKNEGESEFWKWDPDTRVRARGMLSSLKTSAHIVGFCIAKNALQIVKPLASKLQKTDQDVYQAFQMIDGAIERLEQMRESIDKEFSDWYHEADELAQKLTEEIKVPRLTGRQVHRANVGGDTPEDYFRRNVAIPFVDHLKEEMKQRFSKENRIGSSIFSLLPVNILKMKSQVQALREKLMFWEADLETPTSLLAELKEWIAHWERNEDHPTNLLGCLGHADEDQFPNIRRLLIIGCTFPVGSSEAERSFSTFRRLKSYLRSSMSGDRLAGLALMHIHHDMDIDPHEICQEYITKHARRMFQSCLVKQVTA